MKKIDKILIASDFQKPWNPAYYIKKGFEKNKITVHTFDPSEKENSYDALMEAVKLSAPHMLLYIKDYGLKPDWLQEIKKKGIILVQWYIDPVIPDWLPSFVKVSDVFFTMSEGLVEEFKRLGAKNVFWLSQAFEPDFFNIKEITKKDIGTYSTDVTFVGNIGSKPQYLNRRKSLKKIIDSGFKLKWWGPKIPRKFSTIPMILGKLGRAYGGKFVWGEEYAKVARFSKIFLAFDSMPHIRKSMSARMYTSVGCGAFYMCRHVDGIEDVLEPGKEIVTFRSDDEMIDMIRYYLKNNEERMKIAYTGTKRVLKEHTYEVRTREMLRIVEDVIKF
ncbi:MAG: glycosyltransferase [Nitrospirae bacterium]|nr:glycosyltransferase [Nitrospirota bacterium]